MRRLLVLPFLVACGLFSTSLRADPLSKPLPARPARLVAGVQATFTAIAGGQIDVRRDRLVALSVPAGSPPTSFLPPGPFRATFEAALAMPLRGDVTFSFSGAGQAKLTVNGEPVLDESGAALGSKTSAAVRLNKGANKLAISYESPSAGDAAFRLYWAGKDFAREPVPPTVLSVDSSVVPLQVAAQLRAGRNLFAELQCIRCHDAGTWLPAPGTGMPELAHEAPSLAQSGERFRSDWLAAWIADPKAMRADTAMPQVHLPSPQDAADLAAYLGAQGAPQAAPATSEELVANGARMFTDLHCIACHALPGATTEVSGLSRIGLEHVTAKWQPAALVSFLLNPAANHPSIRMPSFRLDEPTAQALAAFLSSQATAALPKAAAGDIAKGKATFISLGCVQCHVPPSGGERAKPSAAPFARVLKGNWQHGCLAAARPERGKAPDFGLAEEQREALRAFAATGLGSLRQEALVEISSRQVTALRCVACHTRDDKAAAYTALADEAKSVREAAGLTGQQGETEATEESLDQDPPSLTWAGEKLQSRWITHLLSGEEKTPDRPWLKARMPAFPGYANVLARGLAAEHGLAADAPAPATGDPAQAKIGETIAGLEGLNCILCHAAGAQPAGAPFGAPGINFALVPLRMRPEFFYRWLDHPQRITPTTKMPKFTLQDGRSALSTVLDGNAHQQWDALHAYMQQLKAP